MRRLEKVSIKEIDLEDTQFLITFLPDITMLRMSIEMVGLLEPPLLRRGGSGLCQVISGFSRIRALRELGVDDVEAFVCDHHAINDLEGMLLALGHNLVRPLNVIEKALIIKKLLAHGLSQREIIDTFLPRIRIQSSAKLLKKFLALLSINASLQEYVVRENLSLGTSSLFVGLDRAACEILAAMLWQLRPGENRVKELVTFLREIALRDSVPLSTVLERQEVRRVLEDGSCPRPRKLEELRRIVRVLRYPQLNAMVERFASFRRSLALPPNMILHAPAFFEGDEYRIEITFAGKEELATCARVLHDIAATCSEEGDDPFKKPCLLYPR